MTALIQFLSAYSVWFYIIGVVGILYAVKMLLDARRQARTTIFALEQEQAGEQSYRAVIVMLFFALLIGGVSAVNTLIAPEVPRPEPAAVKPTALVTRVVILPTFTPIPTLTPEPPTPTNTVPATRPPLVTPTPIPALAPTFTPPRATATPSGRLPAPVPVEPPNGDIASGENKSRTQLTFRWTWSCPECSFDPQTDTYIIQVNYSDQVSGQPRYIQGSAKQAVLRLDDIIRGGAEDVYHKAANDQYSWTVQVFRNGQELTPRSQPFTFVWH